MSDFSHLKKLRVKDDATAEFVFYLIEGNPTLVVSHAGSTNRKFVNGVMKQSKTAIRKARKSKGKSAGYDLLQEVRTSEANSYSNYVVRGWTGVVDTDGKEIEFSVGECEEFLRAIPLEMFDDLRDFCREIDNFREDIEEEMDPDELEGLVKN